MAPTKLDKLLDKHALLFKEELGKLTDVTVKLQVDHSVPPKFLKRWCNIVTMDCGLDRGLDCGLDYGLWTKN